MSYRHLHLDLSPGLDIEMVLGNGAFNRREIFDHLRRNRFQPVIKTRSNANAKQEDLLREPEWCKKWKI